MSAAEKCGQAVEPAKGPIRESAPESIGELTTDKLLGKRITLMQPARGFRAGSDSLLLAASVPARPGERILEAGIGPGAAALALLVRVGDTRLVGIESAGEHAALARRNGLENGFAERLEVVDCDIAEATSEGLRSLGVACGFDHAMANPPFFEAGRARPPASASRRSAHLAAPGELGVWVARLGDAVKGGGTVSMIHRAEAMGEVVAAFARHVGGPVVLPVAAREGDDATRIIVQARKGSRAQARLMAPLVMHQQDGSHTRKANLVLRHCAAIDLASSPVSIRAATCEEK